MNRDINDIIKEEKKYFRCKFMPYLQDVLLPIYEDYLRKELCLRINFNKEQYAFFREYIFFSAQLFNVSPYKNLRTTDWQSYDDIHEEEFMQIFPIFETMQKIVRIMKDIISKEEITEEQRNKILKDMSDYNTDYLSEFL